MNRRTRDGFYMLWTLAILLCLGVCIFLLIWVSFADGGDAATVVPGQTDLQGQTDALQQSALPTDGTQTADGTLPADGTQTTDGTQPVDGTQTADGTQSTDEPQAPAENAASGSVILAETADAGQSYIDRLTFLGDSTTYGMYAYGVLPHYQVWTPASGTLSLFNYAVESIDLYTPGGGDTPQSLPIMDCASQTQPEYLVITLGINGVNILDEEQFKQYYSGLINDVLYASPNTKIICNSIYPVIDGQAPSDITNAKINAANGWILDVATQTGTRYLNTHDALTDASGNLSTDYISPDSDGIHMHTGGYEAILQYIRTHAWL